MLQEQRLELAREVEVSPQGEIGVDPTLEGGEPQLLEPDDGRLGERFVREVHERRAAPERERGTQQLGRPVRLGIGERATPLLDEPLEAVEVELLGLDPQLIASLRRLQ
jgi:hypothetical protein